MITPFHALDALLLDAGGTLVFVDHEAVAEVLAGRGHAVAASQLAATERRAHRRYCEAVSAGAGHEDGWFEFMRQWLLEVGIPAEQAPAGVAALRAEHDRFNLWRRPADGLSDALSAVKAAGLKLGIVSNSEGQLERLLRRISLRDPFDVVVDSGVEGIRKPDPAIFHRCCERLGVAPERCLYVGDNYEVDVLGAQAAGIGAVLIAAEPADVPASCPDDCVVMPSVAELVRQLLATR